MNENNTKPVSTPIACAQRWSEDEDNRLLSTYKSSRRDSRADGLDLDDDAVWEHVSSVMSTRSAVQCLLRYMKLTTANRVSEIDCTVAADNKRDCDEKSPSTATTCSGSSRKKSKHCDYSDDWTEEENDRLAEVMLQYQDGCELYMHLSLFIQCTL